MIGVQLLVTGIVQGVGYRAWAAREARGLGLNGFVRNLADGRVEICTEGPADAVEALVVACKRGPRGAQVTDVVRLPRLTRHPTSFVVLADAASPEQP